MKITAEFKKLEEDDYLPDGGERKQVITPERALNILKNISDEDCRILGFDPEHAHPSWFVLQRCRCRRTRCARPWRSTAARGRRMTSR